MSNADDDDLKLTAEEVERRREPRGVFPGLKIAITGQSPVSYEAVEGGRRGFFVAEANPDRFALGALVRAAVSLHGQTAHCTLEVFRKENSPRLGIALRVAKVSPADDELLRLLFLHAEPKP